MDLEVGSEEWKKARLDRSWSSKVNGNPDYTGPDLCTFVIGSPEWQEAYYKRYGYRHGSFYGHDKPQTQSENNKPAKPTGKRAQIRAPKLRR